MIASKTAQPHLQASPFRIPAGLPINPAQDNALALYQLGLNVLPMPYGRKYGWAWRPFQFTRLRPQDLYRAFLGQCNVAVMCGRTSDNLFVIDCETAETFDEQGRRLKQAGIPIYAVRSGGARGGGHYYLRCADGEIVNIPRGKLPDMEIRGNRVYVLAPPSVHPDTGVIYQWAERETPDIPIVHVEQITWLPLRITVRPLKTLSAPSQYSQLCSKTRDFLVSGAPVGQRNIRLFAAACDMMGVDYDEHSARAMLASAAERSGLERGEIYATIKSAYSHTREPARKQPALHPLRAWEKAVIYAEQQHWKGRAGQTDRAVFTACCERARVDSNQDGVFRASIREVAELAQIDKNTASRSLKRLTRDGWLILCGRNRASGANLWHFGDNLRNAYTIARPTGLTVCVAPNSSFGDAFENKALGKTAAFLWRKLLEIGSALSAQSIVVCCRLSINQVYRALKRLRRFELVCEESHRWAAVPAARDWLDEHVAKPCGMLGKGEQRRASHQEDRARRAGKLIFASRRVYKGIDVSGVDQLMLMVDYILRP